MELEEMLTTIVENALAKQAETQTGTEDMVKKAVEAAVATALEAQKAEFDDMMKKAIHLDRQGTGSQTSQVEEVTLESDPLAFLSKKARSIKSDAEYTAEEQAVISQIWYAVVTDGMRD